MTSSECRLSRSKKVCSRALYARICEMWRSSSVCVRSCCVAWKGMFYVTSSEGGGRFCFSDKSAHGNNPPARAVSDSEVPLCQTSKASEAPFRSP